MANVTATGSGSGIDIDSLVRNLVDTEGLAKTQKLDLDEAEVTADITAYGTLKSALAEFQGVVNGFQATSDFLSRVSTSEDTDYFTVSNTSAAQVGAYDIEVKQLAQPAKSRSKDFTNANSLIGTGNLHITVGGKQDVITIPSGSHSVEGIRDAINANTTDHGLTATMVTVDAGVRLVFSAQEAGAANTISISVSNDGDGQDGDNAGLSQLITGNLTVIDNPLDSIVSIDGADSTQKTNTITDVIGGVTINLLKTHTASETDKLTIATDSSSVVTKVGDFIEAYNSLITSMNELGKYGEDEVANGALLGDATLRNVVSAIRAEISSIDSNNSSVYKLLAQVGVTTNDGLDGAEPGTLKLKSSDLLAALDADFEGVGEMFAGTNGLGNRLTTVVNTHIEFNGILDRKVDGLEDTVTNIQDDREQLELYLDRLETRLFAQFNAMDALVAQLQATSDFLSQSVDTFVKPQAFEK